MIFKDSSAMFDSIDYPEQRGNAPCINCGKDWARHAGWSCDESVHANFSVGRLDNCYMTVEMFEQSGNAILNEIGASRYLQLYNKKLATRQPPVFTTTAKLASPPVVMKKDVADHSDQWRAWANNRPGECPCGIVKLQCEYHR